MKNNKNKTVNARYSSLAGSIVSVIKINNMIHMSYEFNFRTFKVLAIERFQMEIEHLVEINFGCLVFPIKSSVCKNSIKKKLKKITLKYFEKYTERKIGKLLFVPVLQIFVLNGRNNVFLKQTAIKYRKNIKLYLSSI